MSALIRLDESVATGELCIYHRWAACVRIGLMSNTGGGLCCCAFFFSSSRGSMLARWGPKCGIFAPDRRLFFLILIFKWRLKADFFSKKKILYTNWNSMDTLDSDWRMPIFFEMCIFIKRERLKNWLLTFVWKKIYEYIFVCSSIDASRNWYFYILKLPKISKSECNLKTRLTGYNMSGNSSATEIR